MNLQTYTRVMVDTLDNYMFKHTECDREIIRSWCDWGWMTIYRDLWDARDAIVTARSVFDLLSAIEWASHLNHASGSIFDYCVGDRYEMQDQLNLLEQQGLDKAFPKWRKQYKKTIRRMRYDQNIPDPDTLEELVKRDLCVYCGSQDLPLDIDGEALELTCFKCSDLIAMVGLCLTCEHGIGTHGQLCFDCATSVMEVLL